MKIAVVGYGRMGREVEAVLRERSHEAVVVGPGEAMPEGCAVGIDFTHAVERIVHSFAIFATVFVQALVGLLPGNLGGMEGTHLVIFNVLGIGSARSLIYTIILRIGQMRGRSNGQARGT